MITDLLEDWAHAAGCDVAWGPIRVIDEVYDEFERRRRGGEFDPRFDRERLTWFHDRPEMPIPNAHSIIILAVPRPAHIVTFEAPGGPLEALLPPTYVFYRKTRDALRRELTAEVLASKHQLKILVAPLKALAARLGLVRYGRNNITYTRRCGSYHQLVGFITDAALDRCDTGTEAALEPMETCASCGACLKACPTKAIAEDRFLLHAERCLTFHNEGEAPWPDGLDASVHHCLVGCMRCQENCPNNSDRLTTESTGVSFSMEETDAILTFDKASGDALAPKVLAKLELLGLDDDAPILGRNLRALLATRG
jgi:epoxyqueuosine reductase